MWNWQLVIIGFTFVFSVYALWLSIRVGFIVERAVNSTIKIAVLNRSILTNMKNISNNCDCCDSEDDSPKSYCGPMSEEERAAMESRLERLFEDTCSDDSKGSALDYPATDK